ncbi:MAG TPA: hypothetical protein VF174_14615, partial [Micromonosporaceae bacterium]
AHQQTWQAVLAAIVGALPPAVAGLAVHMRALIRRESHHTQPPAPVEQPTAEQPARVVEQHTPTAEQPAPVAVQPATPATAVPALSVPVEQLAVDVDTPARVVQPALVPVPASAFTRVNGSKPRAEVDR